MLGMTPSRLALNRLTFGPSTADRSLETGRVRTRGRAAAIPEDRAKDLRQREYNVSVWDVTDHFFVDELGPGDRPGMCDVWSALKDIHCRDFLLDRKPEAAIPLASPSTSRKIGNLSEIRD